jgi:heat shock protein HtpX
VSPGLASARNVLKAWLLAITFCGLLGLLGWALDGYRLLSIFVFCGMLVVVGVWWLADRAPMGMLKARELVLGEAPAVHSTVERLAARAGIAKPRLYLIPDPLPRAASGGRGWRGASIALSSGALALAPAELDGVLAHEIAHIRRRDVLVQTIAVVIAVLLVETSRIGGWLSRALLFVLAPVASAFVHLLLSPKREFDADRAAAGYCDSPHGLADALLVLERASELVPFEANPATEPLYTINPFLEEGLAALFSTHPPIEARVQRLRALDPGGSETLAA